MQPSSCAPRAIRPAGVPIAQRGPGWSYRLDATAPSLHGRRQAGIATPRSDHVQLAAFDLHGEAVEALRGLTAAGEELLGPQLTVTIGLGPGVFAPRTRPVTLRELPAFAGDALEPAWSGGDLVLQVCAARADDAAAATDRLAPRSLRVPRRHARPQARSRPRPHVGVDRGDRTGMVDGTYLVRPAHRARRRAFAARPLEEQELLVGRHRGSGAPFGGGLLAFMRDPPRQFVPVQRWLAAQDRLAAFARHTGSAVFGATGGEPRRVRGGPAARLSH